MTGEMLRKWQYIAARLERHYDNEEAAEASRWMDEFLKIHYPGFTDDWISEYEDIHDDQYPLRTIVRDPSFCTACEDNCFPSPSSCTYCEFGKVFGQCQETNSWYDQIRRYFS